MPSKRWDCLKAVIKMNKLEQLINELCPNGVEYRRLENCCEILDNKRKPVTKSAREAGKYPYYGANGIQDYVSNYIFDGTFVLVGEDGSVVTEIGTPIVTWATGKIWVNNHAHIISEINGVLLRYLFHYLQTVRVKHLIHGNIPKLTGGDFRALKIAVPPLPVQEEIVRILDKFTELTAELIAELIARKQQYEYYKSSLLTFGNEIEWKSLGDVCIVQAGGTPSKNESLYWENGNIKWLSSTVCKNQKNVDEITNYITEQGLLKSSAKMMKANTTLIALVGATIGKVAFLPFKAAINQNIAGIYPINDNDVDPSYVYYACTMLYPKFLELSSGKLAMANLSFVRNLKIPIPPLEKQQRIVDILDRFDKLCNDISDGLPAEIEARQKQYEYYRDKLLTFKKKEATENE